MENYQIIIIAIVMFFPITLILSTLHHIKVEKENCIKQKFEIISLSVIFLINLLEIGLAIFLFFVSVVLFTSIINGNHKSANLFIVLFGITALAFSFVFLKVSIYFFRHLYFESSRNLYFEKETKTIIVNKKDSVNQIDLNSPNIEIISYITNFGKLTIFGKTEIHDGENLIVFSELLNLTPELEENIINQKNRKVIRKNFNWI